MTRRFGDVLDGASPRYTEVDLGDDGTFHRVLASGYPDAEAARQACEALRARDTSTFCKVVASGE
jgi:hypothetical protein